MNAEASKKSHSHNSKKDSGSTGNSVEENRRETGRKRKSCSSPEPPRKRQRGSEKSVEAEMPRGTKRKASPEQESPKRKRRNTDTSTTSGESTKESVESDSKTVINSDQLSENEDLCLPLSDSSFDSSSYSSSSSSSCGPSALIQDEHNRVYCNKDIKYFEAKYVEVSKIGQGGFGCVYAGYRKSDHLPVAIKHISKEDARPLPIEFKGKTCMFPMEVLLMIRAADGPEGLGKSAAIQMLDWFDLEEEDILVMERPLPCVDLRHYLLEITGPMENNQAKNIMKQLVEAAIHMHSQGVFHCDIKLENILVETGSDVPRVRVIDFGCGRFLQQGPYLDYSGTIAYAPPEFFLEWEFEAGPTTVWQLGLLLYELLVGKRHFHFPYNQGSFFQELRELNMPEDCQDFLKICLAEDPQQRATLEQMQQHSWLN